MNPQFHDEFVALCALYHSGEITEEEWALLQIHLAYCDSCHQQFLQFEQIASGVVPALASVAAAEPGKVPPQTAAALDEAERRLMGSVSPPKPMAVQKRKIPWKLAVAVAAACLIGFVALLTRDRMTSHEEAHLQPNQFPAPEVQSPPAHAVPGSDAQVPKKPAEEAEVAKLRAELLTTQVELKKANLAKSQLEQNLKEEQSARAQLSQERNTLSQQLAAAQSEAASLRDQSTTDSLRTADLAAREKALEAKVHALSAQIEEKDVALNDKDRMLALDKDFLSHDRDIRDLIGARNLYIADIFDTNQNGKTAKPFGRIFYTKDRSLVFYGFDLDKRAGTKQDASFQVWGRGSDQPVVSLGLFYQDDAHQRWILRCNDAKALAHLDMVFVTVEPPGGSTKPTGKQLLRAYLQIPANHP